MENKNLKNQEKLVSEEKHTRQKTPEQIRRRKMALVVPIFILITAVFIYYIFFGLGEKTEDNQNELDGINTEIPDPRQIEIPDDKRKAYEEENLRKLQQNRVRNLNDFYFNKKDSNVSGKTVVIDQIHSNRKDSQKKDPLSESNQVYKEVTKQINSFYQEPVTEKSEQIASMEKEIEELKNELNQKTQPDPAEIMERGYQMAAKYLLPKEEKIITQKQDKFTVKVSKKTDNTVSFLPQQTSQKQFITEHTVPRNYGFNTITESNMDIAVNTIRACIHENQTVINGSRVKLRLLENILVDGVEIPKNSIVYGTVQISPERLIISVPYIEFGNRIFPVELSVFDTDGNKGVHAPGTLEITAAKEALANLGQGAGQSISIARDAKQQLAMDASKIVVQAGSQYLGKKMREVKVNLKAGYQILLVTEKID